MYPATEPRTAKAPRIFSVMFLITFLFECGRELERDNRTKRGGQRRLVMCRALEVEVDLVLRAVGILVERRVVRLRDRSDAARIVTAQAYRLSGIGYPERYVRHQV